MGARSAGAVVVEVRVPVLVVDSMKQVVRGTMKGVVMRTIKHVVTYAIKDAVAL